MDALQGLLPGTTGNLDPSSAFPGAGDFGVALGSGTGQHGVQPVVTGGDGMGNGGMSDAVSDVWEWLNTPFRQPMSPMGIFALIGTTLVAIIAWNMILYHIRIAGEAL
jgi:hypothetical protein